MNSSIEKLTALFERFPGIGSRQARRFTHFLLTRDRAYIKELMDSISTLHERIAQCPSCFSYFEADGQNLCKVCRNPDTANGTLMVLEKDADMDTVKQSAVYKGRYFILGGLVPIVEKKTQSHVRINELKKKIELSVKNNELKEIILAFSLSPQGDYTDTYVREMLAPTIEMNKVTLTSLGRGLSTGSELEYSDPETLKNALGNRK